MKSKLLLFALFLYLIHPMMGCGNKSENTNPFLDPLLFPPTSSGLPFGAGGAGGSTPNATEQQLTGDWISDATTSDGEKVILNFNFSGGERLTTAKTLKVTGLTSIVSSGFYEVKDNNLILKLTLTTYQAAMTLKTNPEELWIGSEKYTRFAVLDGSSISGQIHVGEEELNGTVKVSSTPYVMDQVFVKYKKSSKAALTLNGSTAASTYVPVKISEVTSQKPELQALTIQKLVTTPEDGDLSQLVLDQRLLKEKQAEHFQQTVEALRADPNVESVSFNHLMRAQAEGPDPEAAKQTNLKAIQAPEAWDLVKNNGAVNQVVVAVIDSGVRSDHPDLADHILKDATGKVIGYDFVKNESFKDPDDDKIYAFDQADKEIGPDKDPTDPGDGWIIPGATDGNSWHGTHVSGVIAAVRNNGVGISGLADNVKIMPLRALGWHGYGLMSFIIQAINYAAQLPNIADCKKFDTQQIDTNKDGNMDDSTYSNFVECDYKGRPLANIINLSLGYPMTTIEAKPLMEAVNNATQKGIMVVAASGNKLPAGEPYAIFKKDGDKKDGDFGFFPAAGENVLAVGSIGTNGIKASTSNHGPYVDIYAPGEGIYSTTWYINADKKNEGADYGIRSGTSQATPQVTGIAALLYGKKKLAGDLSDVTGVRDTLKKNAASLSSVDLASGSCGETTQASQGAGLLKAYFALVDGWGIPAKSEPTLSLKATKISFGPYGSLGVVGLDNLGTKPITDLTLNSTNVAVPTGVSDSKWFTVKLDSGGCTGINKSASLQFEAHRKGLPVGTYKGEVSLSSVAVKGDITVTVEMEVKEAIDVKGLLGVVGDLSEEEEDDGETDTDGDGVADDEDGFMNFVDVGDLYVLLKDPVSKAIVTSYDKTSLASNYFFMIVNIPVGTYLLEAGLDTNKDGHICDLTVANPEPCTVYPDLIQIKAGTHIEDIVINF